MVTEELQYNRAPASRVWNIARELDLFRIETILVGKSVASDEIIGSNVIAIRQRLTGFFGNLLVVLQISSSVMRVALTKGVRIVILRGYSLAPLSLLLRLWGKNIIYDFHGFAYKEQMVEGRRLRARITRPFDWVALRLANHVITIREELLHDLPPGIQAKTILMPNGVDLEEFAVPLDKTILAKYGLPDDKKLVGFVGNWEAWLAMEDMLESARYLDEDTKLVIIGSGKRFEEYKASYPSILFTGQVPHQDAVALLKMMDVCVCPYSNEPIAKNKSYRKVLEYLAAGKPIISSNALSREKFLKEGENDLTYRAGEPEELARQVTRILSDDELRTRMGFNNLRLAKTFSWQERIRISGLIEVLLNQRRCPAPKTVEDSICHKSDVQES